MVQIADDLHDDENWTGGFYELCLVLGAVSDDDLDMAMRSLWRVADVQGCWVRRTDTCGLADVEPGAAGLHEHGHWLGRVALSTGERVVCGAFLFRYGDVDTVEFYLPLGALARVDRRIGGYPFDDHSGVESLTWRAGLDRWLADVAIAVYAEVPFRRALMGFEIDEDRDITVDERYVAALVPGPAGLDYRPANA